MTFRIWSVDIMGLPTPCQARIIFFNFPSHCKKDAVITSNTFSFMDLWYSINVNGGFAWFHYGYFLTPFSWIMVFNIWCSLWCISQYVCILKYDFATRIWNHNTMYHLLVKPYNISITKYIRDITPLLTHMGHVPFDKATNQVKPLLTVVAFYCIYNVCQ